jgi:hypothetical protein
MISQFTKDVIIEMLLSDGHLKKKFFLSLNRNARLKFFIQNLEFTENIYQIFKNDNMVGANFRKYEYYDIRHNKTFSYYIFNTIINHYLNEIYYHGYTKIYNKKKKYLNIT